MLNFLAFLKFSLIEIATVLSTPDQMISVTVESMSIKCGKFNALGNL